jgi:hypothetical protein
MIYKSFVRNLLFKAFVGESHFFKCHLHNVPIDCPCTFDFLANFTSGLRDHTLFTKIGGLAPFALKDGGNWDALADLAAVCALRGLDENLGLLNLRKQLLQF